MLDALKMINLALAFFLELAMLGAFAYWGFQTGKTTLVKFGLGIGLPLLAAVIWGVFMAPNSSTRLQGAAYLALKVALFALASAALYAAGSRSAAILLAVVFAVNTLLLYVWKQ